MSRHPKGKGLDYESEYALAVAAGDVRKIRMCLSKDSYSSEWSAEAVAQERMTRTSK